MNGRLRSDDQRMKLIGSFEVKNFFHLGYPASSNIFDIPYHKRRMEAFHKWILMVQKVEAFFVRGSVTYGWLTVPYDEDRFKYSRIEDATHKSVFIGEHWRKNFANFLYVNYDSDVDIEKLWVMFLFESKLFYDLKQESHIQNAFSLYVRTYYPSRYDEERVWNEFLRATELDKDLREHMELYMSLPLSYSASFLINEFNM